MKSFKSIHEEKQQKDSTKTSLTTTAVNNLLRQKGNKKANVKDVLMLIAALTLLNSPEENSLSLSAARRLVSSGNSV